MNPVRVAVIGAGHLGRIHARQLAARSDIELAAVVDPIASLREAVARDCRTQPVAEVRALIGKIDAAIVATPTSTHAVVGQTLLDSGVHCLIEKPLASSAAEAAVLVTTARDRGAVLQVGHVERFNPAWIAAQSNLNQPKYVEAQRMSGFKFRSTDIGVVLDLMIHDLDLLLSIARAPVRTVSALGVALFGPHEDVAHVRLEFADGCIANLTASRASYAVERRLQVWNETGFHGLDFARRTARSVVLGPALAAGPLPLDEMTVTERGHLEQHLFDEVFCSTELPVVSADQITAEHDDFLNAIRTNRLPQVGGAQGLAVLTVAEQILGAIRQHHWDGTPEGRVGPHLESRQSVIRPPHWLQQPARVRREAG